MSTAGKLAPCVLKTKGIPCFEMFINGNSYGTYPMIDDCAKRELEMAIQDAKDYGYDGICFYFGNETLPKS